MINHEFEWDEAKAEANFQKHGVEFQTATKAFNDAYGIDEVDDSMSYGEQRYRLLARVGSHILLVVYSERAEIIRIISARQATRREHDRYFRENTQD
jgi:uncharacterized DUF497 family protein